jgi:hypothetical protein
MLIYPNVCSILFLILLALVLHEVGGFVDVIKNNIIIIIASTTKYPTLQAKNNSVLLIQIICL